MNEKKLLSSWKYRALLQKAYFERGNNLFSVTRYAVFGGFFEGFTFGVILLLCYGFIAYLTGRLWFKYKMPIYEAEIGNQFNFLSKQLRKKVIREEK